MRREHVRLAATVADSARMCSFSQAEKKILKNRKIVINNSGSSIALLYSCDCTRSALGPPLSSVPPPPLSGGSFKGKPQKYNQNAVFSNLMAKKIAEQSLHTEETLYLAAKVALDYEFDGW